MIYATFFTFVVFAVFFTLNTDANEATTAIRCGPNESRLSCGTECEDRCNGPRPRACREMQCPDRACRCNEGFVRNPYTNECIRRGQCPIDGCARGEIAAACGRRCEGTCNRPTQPEICQRIYCSKRECRCDLRGEYVRNSDGQCVKFTLC